MTENEGRTQRSICHGSYPWEDFWSGGGGNKNSSMPQCRCQDISGLQVRLQKTKTRPTSSRLHMGKVNPLGTARIEPRTSETSRGSSFSIFLLKSEVNNDYNNNELNLDYVCLMTNESKNHSFIYFLWRKEPMKAKLLSAHEKSHGSTMMAK